jgi:tRNA-dihydrouridine synthase A
MLGLYQGQYGGRQYRRHLSEHAHKAESDVKILLEAMAFAATRPSAQLPPAEGLRLNAES